MADLAVETSQVSLAAASKAIATPRDSKGQRSHRDSKGDATKEGPVKWSSKKGFESKRHLDGFTGRRAEWEGKSGGTDGVMILPENQPRSRYMLHLDPAAAAKRVRLRERDAKRRAEQHAARERSRVEALRLLEEQRERLKAQPQQPPAATSPVALVRGSPMPRSPPTKSPPMRSSAPSYAPGGATPAARAGSPSRASAAAAAAAATATAAGGGDEADSVWMRCLRCVEQPQGKGPDGGGAAAADSSLGGYLSRRAGYSRVAFNTGPPQVWIKSSDEMHGLHAGRWVRGTAAPAPGWEEVTDPKTGEPYYWNRESNQTSWVMPRAAVQVSTPPMRAAQGPVSSTDDPRYAEAVLRVQALARGRAARKEWAAELTAIRAAPPARAAH
jgi:hypothetical protein